MEKKLTDEEVIEVLKNCGAGIHSSNCECRNCVLEDDGRCVNNLRKYSLDLIHRLQEKRKRIGAYKVLSDATLFCATKGDLIDRIRVLEHNWSATEEALNNSAKNAQKLLAEKKAEIERLKEDNEQWETLYHIGEERKYRKMFVEEWKKEYQKELDKQGEGLIAGSPDFDYVYELFFKQKAEIERLKGFIDFKTANVMCDKCKEQAVKDTAKKYNDFIHALICKYNSGIDDNAYGNMHKEANEFANRNGVEVE